MPLDRTDDKSTLVQVMAWWQQAISWASVDLDPCRHMTSLGLSELNMTGFDNGLLPNRYQAITWAKHDFAAFRILSSHPNEIFLNRIKLDLINLLVHGRF